MGLLFPRKLMKWREPRKVRRAREATEEKRLSPWVRPLGVLAVAAVFWIISLLGVASEDAPITAQPCLALLMLVGLGVFLVYLVPLMLKLCPAQVLLTEKALVRVVGNTGTHLPYESIHSCEIVSRTFGEESFSILAVVRRKGSPVAIGIDPKVDIEQLARILEEHSVTVVRPGNGRLDP